MTEGAKQIPIIIPIPGKITKVNVKAGDKISKDDVLLVFESMKMELNIQSPSNGLVKNITAIPGQIVPANSVVATLEETV
jgi:biotin carboxyl carrier protein